MTSGHERTPYDRQTASLPGSAFSQQLRYWRLLRGMSQMDLALAADVSPRHISFLETGRSRASESTIVRLASALGLSRADVTSLSRGNLRRGERRLPPDPEMQDSMRRIVDAHSPYPALVVDSIGTIHHANDGMRRLVDALCMRHAASKNLFELYFAPDGFRSVVEDADRIGPLVFNQTRRDLLSLNRPEATRVLETISRLAPDLAKAVSKDDEERPVVEVALKLDDVRLRVSSVFPSFGADNAGNRMDWQVETIFALDDQSASFFRK